MRLDSADSVGKSRLNPTTVYRPVAEFNVDTITNNSGHEIDFGGPTAISAGTVWNVGTISVIGYSADHKPTL